MDINKYNAFIFNIVITIEFTITFSSVKSTNVTNTMYNVLCEF